MSANPMVGRKSLKILTSIFNDLEVVKIIEMA